MPGRRGEWPAPCWRVGRQKSATLLRGVSLDSPRRRGAHLATTSLSDRPNRPEMWVAADAPPPHEVLDRPHGRVRSRRPAAGIDYSASLRIHVFFVSQYGEPVEGRGRAVESRVVRVDRVPGLGPVDAGPRLAGIRGRSQGKGQTFASELGTDHFDPIPDEPNLVL